MQEIKLLLKEVYLSIHDGTSEERECVFYDWIIRYVNQHCEKIGQSKTFRNQILGEMILLGKDVIEECTSIS